MNYQAWVAQWAKQPMVLETVDLGSLGTEVAVEQRGLCGCFRGKQSKHGRSHEYHS
jgi:hypothetical protein